MLEPGSKLFVYTDGVAEATNAKQELFGLQRMIDALNASPEAAPQEILQNIQSAVDDFVQEEEQFDDLTMLCLEYKGQNGPQE
jgi:serine phosphatase RsbU (regulator of sigma subunit)